MRLINFAIPAGIGSPIRVRNTAPFWQHRALVAVPLRHDRRTRGKKYPRQRPYPTLILLILMRV
jgi:hypothetical protein